MGNEPSVRYVDTLSAYEGWANVYDTDGNFLQALDTREMRNLLPKAISMINTPRPWKFVDLGCGTGRNTLNLLHVPDAEIVALDLSPKMLSIARARLEEKAASLQATPNFQLATFDMLGWTSTAQVPAYGSADLIVSTLVVEHIPLARFFKSAACMLKEDGLLLLTNMHDEMGNISQAGFVDPDTGEKIRPASYPHTIKDTLEEAAKHGLEVAEPFREESVREADCSELGARARKWIGIRVWYGGILRKKKPEGAGMPSESQDAA
ncbi:S-adenosyl-L-methionine-dependent methyltransferase [Thozetella sp. PMI_491]|nr:S-adenosyl-L-methionine-dependent methyltransferase [Thozetella sp. PMI_491]